MQMQTDIEVLKTEVRGLFDAVAGVATKIDMLLALQVQLVRLQEQHDTTRKTLDDSFEALRNIRARTEESEGRIATALGITKGGLIIGTFLFSFTLWYVQDQLHSLKEVAKQATGFDLRLSLMESELEIEKSYSRHSPEERN